MFNIIVFCFLVEALYLANLLSAHGYLFPIDDHFLNVKNDGSYYRFQVSIDNYVVIYHLRLLNKKNNVLNQNTAIDTGACKPSSL